MAKEKINRVPFHVSPEFEKRMKELQKKIRQKSGSNISLRELTDRIAKSSDLDHIENKILGENVFDFKINFDSKKLRKN